MFLSQFDICQGRTEQRLKLAGKLPDKQTHHGALLDRKLLQSFTKFDSRLDWREIVCVESQSQGQYYRYLDTRVDLTKL